MTATQPVTVADRIATARALWQSGATLSAAICARWAGIALRESAMPAELAVNPFEAEDEAELAHAFATGLAKGRRIPSAVQTWTPIPGCTHAAHAAGPNS
ncbi:hypothetical protein H261_03343 [Paramagnetospirillum caucaseum]|uniref:Uncharacterized protein n=1 Tax=Paramagnetospirillum caucaseum TaxID=1244869 RepID=M2YEJ9_9PROT|nr:hypothetical protein [Paramagnetospirillum caucaseum]EME71411.1 hypothetical protein H261_03343 [Paramagnetospirillum caucaseum]